MRAVEKIASCEIAFIPIESKDYKADVERVLEIIEQSGLERVVGLLSTTLRGPADKIIRLIEEIYRSMEGRCGFSMDIKLSNLCGCERGK